MHAEPERGFTHCAGLVQSNAAGGSAAISTSRRRVSR